jgi:hypothetical protein
MPLSKQYIPQHMENMRSAFDKVCEALLLNCDVDDPMTEIIANKIVALVKAGEHDADRLAEIVLDDFDGRRSQTPGGKPRQDRSPEV